MSDLPLRCENGQQNYLYGTKVRSNVKGHCVLPIGGHETCPWADTNVPVGGLEAAHRVAQISGVVPVPARA